MWEIVSFGKKWNGAFRLVCCMCSLKKCLSFLFCCLTCAECVLSIGCGTDGMLFVVCEVSLCFCISAVCCILFDVCPSAGRGILCGVREVDMMCVGFCIDCVL